MEDGACEIVLEGADRGTATEKPVPPGPLAFARSLPRHKAIQREVLIAYLMNGPISRWTTAIRCARLFLAIMEWLRLMADAYQAVGEPFLG